MDYGLGKIVEWNGYEGLIEDSNGEIIRFTDEDIHPRNLKDAAVGAIVIITESGYLEFTSQSFAHYIDDPFDGKACEHKKIRNNTCIECGEVSNLED